MTAFILSSNCPRYSYGHERSKVQRYQALAEQDARHLALYYSTGQSLGYGRLANSRFAYQQRVIFLAARKYLAHPLYFLIPAHDRVQFAVFFSLSRQVSFEIVQYRGTAFFAPGRFCCDEKSDDLPSSYSSSP